MTADSPRTARRGALPPDPARRGRRLARALIVAGVVTVCVIPASDALASARSGPHHPSGKQASAGRSGSSRPAPKPRRTTPAATPTASPTTAPDPVSGGPGTGEEPAVRSGEDLRWWPWGAAVSGRLTRPVKGGYSTLVLQRGEITALEAGTVTVTSADGVTTAWTLTAGTRITGTRRATPSLAVHQRVGIWGTETGGVARASFVVVRGQAPAPTTSPTPTPTPTETPTSTPTPTPTVE